MLVKPMSVSGKNWKGRFRERQLLLSWKKKRKYWKKKNKKLIMKRDILQEAKEDMRNELCYVQV